MNTNSGGSVAPLCNGRFYGRRGVGVAVGNANKTKRD